MSQRESAGCERRTNGGGKLLIAAAMVAWASLARAGVADSPAPILPNGATGVTVFIVPGVTKFANLETEFSCTSLSTTPFDFGVEVFGRDGGGPLNDVSSGNGAATLLVGGTRTVGTGGTAGFHEDVKMTLTGDAIKNGSARIVSESKRITCTAFITSKYGTNRCISSSTTNAGGVCTTDADCGGVAGTCRTTPDSVVELKVISKKQRGD